MFPLPFQPSDRPQAPLTDDARLRNEGPHLAGLQPTSVAYANAYFSIKDRGGYFTLEHEVHDVVVIPVIEDREVVMLRPYRPVLGDAPLEFPGGGGLAGETPEETAARELREEAGLAIGDLARFRRRAPFCLSPNRMPRLHHVFEVAISEEEAMRLAPGQEEIYAVERFSFEQAKELIASGTIYVAAVAGVLAGLILQREGRIKRDGT